MGFGDFLGSMAGGIASSLKEQGTYLMEYNKFSNSELIDELYRLEGKKYPSDEEKVRLKVLKMRMKEIGLM